MIALYIRHEKHTKRTIEEIDEKLYYPFGYRWVHVTSEAHPFSLSSGAQNLRRAYRETGAMSKFVHFCHVLPSGTITNLILKFKSNT